MDSLKPYREVVLPKKGTASQRKESRPGRSVPKPREFRRSGEFILMVDEDEVLPEGAPTPETHVLECDGLEVEQQPAPTEESTVMLSATTFLDDGGECATVVIPHEDLAAHLTPPPPAAGRTAAKCRGPTGAPDQRDPRGSPS